MARVTLAAASSMSTSTKLAARPQKLGRLNAPDGIWSVTL